MNEDPLGFVETPPPLADELAAECISLTSPEPGDRICYPGAGRGNIAAAVHRRCSVRGLRCPDGVFIERDPDHLDALRDRFVGRSATHNNGVPPLSDESAEWHRAVRGTIEEAPVEADVEIRNADFLTDPPDGTFEYIVANPPFTYYTQIDADDSEAYAERFEVATGQFPLYAPFVEQMLELLAPNGVLVCLLPVRWLSLQATRPLRNLVRRENPGTPIMVPDCGFQEYTVSTAINFLGRSDANWTGTTRPPSRTSLYLTHIDGPYIRPFLRRLGIDDEEMDRIVDEYLESVRLNQRVIGNTDRRERDIDSQPGRQSALASFEGGEAGVR